MIYNAIISKLATNATIADKLGFDWIDPNDDSFSTDTGDLWGSGSDVKIFPIVGNQQSGYPQIILRASEATLDSHTETTFTERLYDLQVDVYDQNYDLCEEVGAAVRETLYLVENETINSTLFKRIQYQGMSSGHEEADLYRLILNFKCHVYAS